MWRSCSYRIYRIDISSATVGPEAWPGAWPEGCPARSRRYNDGTLTDFGARKAAQRPFSEPRAAARVDYSLARKSVLRAFKAGRTSRFDICDAHPELVRAAKYCGEQTHEPCPICDHDTLLTVAYVFSDSFGKKDNGRVWSGKDVAPLLKLKEARLYTVEVCVDCSWNHVRSQLMLTGSSTGGSGRGTGRGKGRRAST